MNRREALLAAALSPVALLLKPRAIPQQEDDEPTADLLAIWVPSDWPDAKVAKLVGEFDMASRAYIIWRDESIDAPRLEIVRNGALLSPRRRT